MTNRHDENSGPHSVDTPVRRPIHAFPRERRGVALLTAILGVVIITVLILGGFFASTQEFRGGRNLLVEQRAFAIAEYGLNNEVADWDRGRNITMKVGEIDDTRRYVADGDTAFVKITKLTGNTFWVVSEGRASLGSSAMESGRLTNAYVRLAYPSIDPKGAITTAGNVETQGNFVVSGDDTDPAGWGGMCDDIAGGNVAAFRVAPAASVSIHKTENVIGGVSRDPAAADSNTYVRYGSETWESLVQGADIVISAAAGSNYNAKVEPTLDDGKCENVDTNWGEPFRPGVSECRNRFPIIYSAGDLHLKSNGRGQGILLVNGNLTLNGNFDFYGIVIVRDNIKKGNGTATIHGAVYARDAVIGGNNWFSGNQNIYYSRCAVENALRGSAILVRVKERHWTQML
ncbi:MAG TPA: pilus assembly PilX N-terminal domain-containing protein [Gemmatimonadales bacterium]